MKKTIAVVMSVVAVCLTVTLLVGTDAFSGEETLQGTWNLRSGEANGTALSTEQIQGGNLVIKGDHYSVTLNGGETVTGVQKLGATAGIRTIDITDGTGAHKGETCLGIYELKGNEFRVAFAQPGKDRPTDFSTTPDSGNWMHVWEREQK